MTINNPRRTFEERVYIESAFFLQISAKKLHSLYIVPVSHVEFKTIDSLEIIGGEVKYKVLNGKIYYENPYTSTGMMILCSAYIVKEHQAFQLGLMINKLNAWRDKNEKINNIFKRYKSNLASDLSDYIDTVPYFSPKVFNIKQINKVMAKHKGFAEMSNGDIKLTFNKIRSGNDVEGYVNYKFISVFLPINDIGIRNLNSNRIIYGFQKFSFDSNDRVHGIYTLHPHIANNGDFCWGNRSSDWELYSGTYNFPFMIDLLYESLNTFNPASPYLHVNTIINIIKTLTVVYKDYRKLNPAKTPNELANHIFSGVNVCRSCSTVLGTDGKCFRDGCRANENAIITCRCGVTMERGEWEGQQYNWICRNVTCLNSIDHVEPPTPPTLPTPANPEGLLCRICHEPLVRYSNENSDFNHVGNIPEASYRGFCCRNRDHSLRDIWQYGQNVLTGEVIDLFRHHNHDSFVHEMDLWNRTHSTED